VGEEEHTQTTSARAETTTSKQMKTLSISDTTMSMLTDISKRHSNKKVNLIVEDLIEKLYADMKRKGGKVL
jgi:anti-sigma28 factor (negative regulator of flagellin synthesis)